MNEFRTVLGLAAVCLGLGCQASPEMLASPASGCPADAEEAPVAQEAYVGPLDESSTLAVTADALGCTAPAAARSGECADALGGSYAIAYKLDVYWHDEVNPLAPSFDPGRGMLTVLAHARLGEFCDGAHAKVALRTCGLDFPAIVSDAARSVHQISVPDAIWDRPSMPTLLTSAEVSGFGHSDKMTFEPILSTLGIELSDAGGDWPGYEDTPFFGCSNGRAGAACFPDQDADGKPGITLRVQSTGNAPAPSGADCDHFRYASVPTSPGPALDGARELFGGVRVQLRGTQPIGADCNGGTGQMDSAEVALRVLDCTQDDGSPCTVAGATYVDQTLPVFHVLRAGEVPPSHWKAARAEADAALDRSPSAGPEETGIRLGEASENLGCSDVRAAFRR